MNQDDLNEIIQKFKEDMGARGISQPKFAERVYKEVIDPDADDETLYKHTDRFKKLLQKDSHKFPDMICFYIHFYNERYGVNGRYTQKDREAAWCMYVELDTRIATRKLVGGKTEAALLSLVELFSKHRIFSQEAGPNCQQYYRVTTEVFETKLRPFTSKWHPYFDEKNKVLSPDDEKIFRRELVEVQNELNELKTKLLDMCQ